MKTITIKSIKKLPGHASPRFDLTVDDVHNYFANGILVHNCRAWWDGEKFISRLGNTFFAPEWFTAQLPKGVVLDGELWVGRKQFQRTISIVRKHVPSDEEWKEVKYVLFDAPNHGGAFEERVSYLKTLFPVFDPDCANSSQICVLDQTKCHSVEHLKETLRIAVSNGDEGLVLRQPGSLYEADRSWTCLKVKTFLDSEAEVIGHSAGRGKHKGRTGALMVRWGDKEFEIGTGLSDKERESPPKVGVWITFRYTDLTTGGTPKNASFCGVRDYE